MLFYWYLFMRSYLMIMKFVDVVQKKKGKETPGIHVRLLVLLIKKLISCLMLLKPKEQNNERRLESFPSFPKRPLIDQPLSSLFVIYIRTQNFKTP